jgi:hypothetical protein
VGAVRTPMCFVMFWNGTCSETFPVHVVKMCPNLQDYFSSSFILRGDHVKCVQRTADDSDCEKQQVVYPAGRRINIPPTGAAGK